MNTYDIRSLRNGIVKKLNIVYSLVRYFKYWKKLVKENNIKDSDFDNFMAGYMIGSNITLKNEIMKDIKMEEKVTK